MSRRTLAAWLSIVAVACGPSGEISRQDAGDGGDGGDAGTGSPTADGGDAGALGDGGDAGLRDAGAEAGPDAGADSGVDAGTGLRDGGEGGDAGAAQVGDRNLGLTVAFPAGAFAQNGGCVIDLQAPPPDSGIRAAVGDGVTDDTAAFQDAYDYLKAAFVDAGSFPAGCTWFYLRNGTYLVSDTLIYRGPSLEPDSGYDWDDIVGLRFIGESREQTTIQLQDDAPGFQDPANPKIVLAYQHPETRFNNIPASNALDNLTVDVGKGNPGAVGVFFQGANTTELTNVKITSDDGSGAYGLWLHIGSVQGAYRDVTIQGFADGVHQDQNSEVDDSLEHVTIRGQGHVGVAALGGGLTLRAALIDETGTDAGAIVLDQSGAQLAVVDSALTGTAAAAIEVTDGGTHHLFARNVSVAGFGVGIDRAGSSAVAGSVGEYVSDPVVTLFPGQPTHSLALPVLDAPLVPWFDAGTQWANVDDFGAVGDGGVDDTAAIQAALNSGLPVVYFPRRSYRVTKTLDVPATVARIEAFDANLDDATFAVSGAASDALLVRDTTGYGQVQSAATRDVVLQLTSGAFENRQGNAINLFVENCANLGGGDAFTVAGQHTFARSLNDEEGGTQADAGFDPATATADMQVQGGSLWVLNFKTENKPIPALSALPGSFVEVLGGYVNVTAAPGDIPLVVNDGANVSYLGFTNLFCSELQNVIEEFRDGGVATDPATALPPRGYDGCATVPLYVGYDPNAVP